MRFFLYVKHFFSAVNTNGHRVHSPFLFHIIRHVIPEKNSYYCFGELERLRNDFDHSNEVIFVDDFGTGKSGLRKLRDVARKSLNNKKSAQLLYRLVLFLRPKNMLELGTSLGLTTSYLATAAPNAHCVTLEGSKSLCDIAKANFGRLGLGKINIVEGNINDTLPLILSEIDSVDFVFFDANHTQEATLQYFELCLAKKNQHSVFVFDDIYWSKQMQQAWRTIKSNSEVIVTIDLFDLGIVFFNSDFMRKDFKVRF